MSTTRGIVFGVAAAALACTICGAAIGAVPPEQLNRVVDLGLNHSEIGDTIEHLTDQIGGRLTNSPAQRAAVAFAMERLKGWGLSSVHEEGYKFGRGWSVATYSVTMTAPRSLPLIAVPIAWTPGTNGVVNSEVVFAPISGPQDFASWAGKLAGKIVLLDPPGHVVDETEVPFHRWKPEELANPILAIPKTDTEQAEATLADSIDFGMKLDAFLKSQGAVAWVRCSSVDRKLVHGVGYFYREGQTLTLPGFEMAAEDYRRLVRLTHEGLAPSLSLHDDVRFDDSDLNAHNVFADVPGSDSKAGYVMVGAHMDSWATGDGAMDDGAGAAIVMEAARIVAAANVKPKRAIRFALWSGEEEGTLGSIAYVDQHIASRPGFAPRSDQSGIAQMMLADHTWPVVKHPGYDDIKAYFNLDSGGGRIRGVSLQGNLEATPIVKDWLAPLSGLGVTAVSPRVSHGGDHNSFSSVGVPSLTFTSDMLDAFKIYHTNADTLDHLKPDEMRQAATAVAAILLEAADSAANMPAMPLPTKNVSPKAGEF
jgi:carboxypeptidase Q